MAKVKFDLLESYLADAVGNPVHKFLKNKYGAAGLKIEEPFSDKVRWSPTIQIKTSSSELLLVEVSETIYPPMLSVWQAGIVNEEPNRAIKVYQACSYDAFQKDKDKNVRKLKTHGFGLVTVDEAGGVEVQFHGAVLSQHIPSESFEERVKKLPSDVKSALSNAFEVYRTNANQGLQHAGQVVEALVRQLAEHAHKKGWLAKYNDSKPAADLIDSLYESKAKELVDQRACLGGARQFMKSGRNPSSHPAKSKRQAQSKALNVRSGFESALAVCRDLCAARTAVNLRKKLAL